jgi:hypothetical protein
MRVSYDTDEGATLGSETITNGDASDDTFTDSSAHALVGWNNSGTHNATNKVTIESGSFRLISDGTFTGLSAAGASAIAVIGNTYTYTITVSSVSAGSIKITNGGVTIGVSEIGTHTGFFVAESTTTNIQRTSGVTDVVYDDFSLKQTAPAFLNSVSKVDSTLLTPVKQLTENGITSTVFLVYQPWADSVVVPAGGFLTDFDGVQCKYYSSVNGGTTSGTGVADDTGVTDWIEQGNYNNIQKDTAGNGWLTHVVSEGVAVQQLLNSDAPATQTTGSLATGDYVLWQNGAGSSDLTAGTATISTTGSATDGSPLTFTVTGAGTVNVTITGSPDENQLEGGSVQTTFILSAGGTVQRNATEFLVTPTPAAFLRLRFADVVSQTYLSSGTIEVSYDETTLTWTDGTNAMTHNVAMKPGDFATVEEATGKLYYGSASGVSLVDTNGSYDPTWGEIALGNAVDYTFDDELDPLNSDWSQP